MATKSSGATREARTNDDGDEYVHVGPLHVSTGDATPQVITMHTMETNNTVVRGIYKVTARKDSVTGNGDVSDRRVPFTYYRTNTGTVTESGERADYTAGTLGITVASSASGSDIILTLTGIALTNIEWSYEFEFTEF